MRKTKLQMSDSAEEVKSVFVCELQCAACALLIPKCLNAVIQDRGLDVFLMQFHTHAQAGRQAQTRTLTKKK